MLLPFVVRPGVPAATAVAAPLHSALLTGMPPWYPPVAIMMALELGVMAAIASAAWRRWNRSVLLVLVPSLLLDEPSAMLDPPARGRLAELLRELSPAMVIAAHDLEFVRGVCTHFALLEQGRLSSPRPIADMPADPFSQRGPLCYPALALEAR